MAHHGEVPRLHIGMVVLLLCAGAGEVNRRRVVMAVWLQAVVDEFSAVIEGRERGAGSAAHWPSPHG